MAQLLLGREVAAAMTARLRDRAAALREKGYNPINQLVGYLISGDPAYITSHKQARSLIRRVQRDDLIEELVSSYLKEE